ncbi:MAG: uridine kinase [Candidatus Hydrogenedentes bacterium]|nr:uridine kinase [Candidatus Hydrogenedentota bacterium]
MSTLLVLIGGPTCSGKTTIARHLRNSLPAGTSTVVGLDSYYRDLSHLSLTERAAANFDHPDAFDWPLLNADVRRLIAGESVNAPVYDFATHARTGSTILLVAADVLIVEGILALYDEELCRMAQLRVFIEAVDTACLERRIDRDIAERGRTEASVREQFGATVLPMANQYVYPTKTRANLMLSSGEGISIQVQRVLTRVDELRDHS